MSLTSHSVLIVTDRPASATQLRAALTQLGVKDVYLAHSYRETLEIGMRDCPHLFVFDADLPDGSAIGLLKKVRAEPFFDKTPVVVIRKPSREELLEIVKLKVAAVLAKPVEIGSFTEKVKSIFDSMGDSSPYGIKGTELPGGSPTSIRFSASIVGRDDIHLICQSQLSLGDGGSFLITPSDTSMPPIIATSAGSPKMGQDKESNLFGLANIIGKGRAWVMSLPPIKYQNNTPRRVLLFEPQKDRTAQLRDILSFHEIEIEAVDTVQRLAQAYLRSPEEFKVVYISEMQVGSAAIPWDKAIQSIPEAKRPIQVIATSSMVSKPAPNVVWLRKPFAVEQIIETLDAAFATKTQSTSPGLWEKSNKEIPCSYVVKANILSVDEAGGLLELEAPASVNSMLFIEHAKFKGNEKTYQVRIVFCSPSPTNPKLWCARFSNVAAGSSKGNSWRQLKPLLAPAGP